jgi:hypothetical protein
MDYEHEIHRRLSRFPVLNGRGNVRDSTQLLYEVIQLMLEQRQATVPSCSHLEDDIALLETLTALEVAGLPMAMKGNPSVTGEHVEISSDVLHPAPPPAKKPMAPHGLTKFGNPRRIRPPRKKK